jgi:hypothetical protein
MSDLHTIIFMQFLQEVQLALIVFAVLSGRSK